jgi:serine phosphatase RsbU (regulator of sigma subunit)
LNSFDKDVAVPKPNRHNRSPASPKQELSPASLTQEIEDLGSELFASSDATTALKAMAERLVERCGVAAAGIWIVNSATSALELGPAAGRTSFPGSLARVTGASSLLVAALEQGHPQVWSKQDGGDDELLTWAQRHGLDFVAAYPLRRDSQVLGVLVVACAQAPAKTLQVLFGVQARLAAVALHNAALAAANDRTLSKLNFVCEASRALGSTLDLSLLLARILEMAESQVEAERGTLFLVDEKNSEIWSLIAHGLEKKEIRLPLGKGIAGHVAKTGEIVNIPDAYADPRFDPDVDKDTGFSTRNILCVPIQNKAAKTIAVLQLLNRKHGPFTADDTDFLLTLSGPVAMSLENAQLHRELVEKERLEKELALAREIQGSLLPETTPQIEGFDIAVLNKPCYEVSGDYYDFFTTGPHSLLAVIADVEGKGVSSALVMANLQATLRALVLHRESLDTLAETLNRNMQSQTRSRKSLSLFMGLIDVRSKTIEYVNCGHVPPVIVRPNQEALPLTEGGMLIGLFGNAKYERGQAQLQPHDILIMCTDGITESMDTEGQEYGGERLVACVRQAGSRRAAEIAEVVSKDVDDFSRHGQHVDDKVMMVIKVV